MLLHLVLIAAGILLLYFGGEILVSGVSDLAAILKVSPFLIAFTVVAFGTSAPELAASGAAAFEGLSAIAMGNIVGSNIANIGLILGSSALVASLALDRALLRREGPFLLATALVVVGMVVLGRFERLPALVLLVGLVVFLYTLIRGDSVPETSELVGDATAEIPRPPWKSVLMLLGGILFLVGGAKLLVDSASALARAAGISEGVIGLTMVAFGTSVPELASCVVAARRDEGGIVLGNVIGSNVFNTLLISSDCDAHQALRSQLGRMGGPRAGDARLRGSLGPLLHRPAPRALAGGTARRELCQLHRLDRLQPLSLQCLKDDGQTPSFGAVIAFRFRYTRGDRPRRCTA